MLIKLRGLAQEIIEESSDMIVTYSKEPTVEDFLLPAHEFTILPRQTNSVDNQQIKPLSIASLWAILLLFSFLLLCCLFAIFSFNRIFREQIRLSSSHQPSANIQDNLDMNNHTGPSREKKATIQHPARRNTGQVHENSKPNPGNVGVNELNPPIEVVESPTLRVPNPEPTNPVRTERTDRAQGNRSSQRRPLNPESRARNPERSNQNQPGFARDNRVYHFDQWPDLNPAVRYGSDTTCLPPDNQEPGLEVTDISDAFARENLIALEWEIYHLVQSIIEKKLLTPKIAAGLRESCVMVQGTPLGYYETAHGDKLLTGAVWSLLCQTFFSNPFKIFGKEAEALAKMWEQPPPTIENERWRSFTARIFLSRAGLLKSPKPGQPAALLPIEQAAYVLYEMTGDGQDFLYSSPMLASIRRATDKIALRIGEILLGNFSLPEVRRDWRPHFTRVILRAQYMALSHAAALSRIEFGSFEIGNRPGVQIGTTWMPNARCRLEDAGQTVLYVSRPYMKKWKYVPSGREYKFEPITLIKARLGFPTSAEEKMFHPEEAKQ